MKFFRNLKHIFAVSIVSLGMIFWSIYIFQDDFTHSLNGFFLYRTGNWVWQDTVYKHTLSPTYLPWTPGTIPMTQIKIINIDEDSLNYLQSQGRPFWKDVYTEVVQKLTLAWAKGIAFDIVFAVEDREPSKTLTGYTQEEEFAQVARDAGNVVVAADYNNKFCDAELDLLTRWDVSLDIVSAESLPWETNCNKRLGAIIAANYNRLSDADHRKYVEFMGVYYKKRTALETELGVQITGGAVEAIFDTFTDADYASLYCQKDSEGSPYETCLGVPRSVYKDVPWGTINLDNPYTRPIVSDMSSSLPYAHWKAQSWVLDSDKYLYTLPLALYKVTGGTNIYPSGKNVLNPYFGPDRTYNYISLRDFLVADGTGLTQVFAGSYVIMGNTTKVASDFIETPVTGELMPGVETHAHFLEGLLQNKMLAELPVRILWWTVALLTLLSVILYYFVPKYLSPIFAIVMLVGVLYITRYTYDVGRIVSDVFLLFLAGGVVTYPVTYIYRFFIVEHEKRELQSNFGHYIDPHVVEEIVSRGVDIQLGGERRVLSVLFSDIAGFTTISESMNPQDLFYLMTSYLSNMTDILIAHGGTLDKYIGDAVMGFFGAPLSYEDHAIRAADTALLMRARLPLFNDDLVKHGMKPIDFRIGIATGDVMVGNIGSHDRFNYTVLGDTVNLASRLEGTGKEYDVHIIVPEATRNALWPLYLTRELDTIAVKGKTEWVRIYELVGYAKDYPDRTLYFTYEKALALYRKWDYREAGKLWQTQAHEDPPSHVMMYRCLNILKWLITVEDGIYHMTHK
jgi:class 3 adenylate cyclase/CHASE2 domain-containing sensor protein